MRITSDLKRQLADVARSRGLSMSDFATLVISEAVRSFYEKHRFQRSPVNPYHLILPMQTIRQLNID